MVAVAKVLGPVKAREELVPRVATFAEESDDEVAMELAQQLGNMIPAVGGAQHAASLLRPLEALAGMEEAVVRNKAVESLCKIAAELPQPDVASSLLPLVQVRTFFLDRGGRRRKVTGKRPEHRGCRRGSGSRRE